MGSLGGSVWRWWGCGGGQRTFPESPGIHRISPQSDSQPRLATGSACLLLLAIGVASTFFLPSLTGGLPLLSACVGWWCLLGWCPPCRILPNNPNARIFWISSNFLSFPGTTRIDRISDHSLEFQVNNRFHPRRACILAPGFPTRGRLGVRWLTHHWWFPPDLLIHRPVTSVHPGRKALPT